MDTAQCSAILDLELKWHWLSWDCGLRVATQWQRHQRHYSARSNQAYALMATTSGCPLSTHPPLCFSSPFEPFLLAHLHGSLIVHGLSGRRGPSGASTRRRRQSAVQRAPTPLSAPTSPLFTRDNSAGSRLTGQGGHPTTRTARQVVPCAAQRSSLCYPSPTALGPAACDALAPAGDRVRHRAWWRRDQCDSVAVVRFRPALSFSSIPALLSPLRESPTTATAAVHE
jgi:hypothetical protein